MEERDEKYSVRPQVPDSQAGMTNEDTAVGCTESPLGCGRLSLLMLTQRAVRGSSDLPQHLPEKLKTSYGLRSTVTAHHVISERHADGTWL